MAVRREEPPAVRSTSEDAADPVDELRGSPRRPTLAKRSGPARATGGELGSCPGPPVTLPEPWPPPTSPSSSSRPTGPCSSGSRRCGATASCSMGLVRKELKVKYKDSSLGFFWSMLNPAMYLVVFYVVFQIILGSGIPFFAIYLLSGLLAWNLFSGSVTGATGSIVSNGSLVNKVYFPREILPLATVGANLVHFFLQTARAARRPGHLALRRGPRVPVADAAGPRGAADPRRRPGHPVLGAERVRPGPPAPARARDAGVVLDDAHRLRLGSSRPTSSRREACRRGSRSSTP